MVPLSPTPFLPSRFQPRPEERRRQDGHEQGPWGRLGGPTREAGHWWCHENQPAVPWNVLMCVTHRRRGGPATVKERDAPGGNQPRLPRSPPWESDPGPGQGKAMGWLDVRVFHVPVLSHTGALGTSRPTYTPKRTAAKTSGSSNTPGRAQEAADLGLHSPSQQTWWTASDHTEASPTLPPHEQHTQALSSSTKVTASPPS